MPMTWTGTPRRPCSGLPWLAGSLGTPEPAWGHAHQGRRRKRVRISTPGRRRMWRLLVPPRGTVHRADAHERPYPQLPQHLEQVSEQAGSVPWTQGDQSVWKLCP